MVLNNKFRQKGVNAALTALLYLLAGVCCFAQEKTQLLNQDKNADNSVQLAPNLNPDAVATPLAGLINSPYAEFKPAVAPHGKRMYFSRASHPNNVAGVNDREDIWYTEFDSLAENWSEPVRLPGFLNNEGPNFVSGVSVSGDTIILGNRYLKKGKMTDGLSYSVNIEGQWGMPQPIRVKNDYNLSVHGNSYVSLDQGVIISAVERTDTKGERDLYVSFWDGQQATEPINMGGVINSNMEESSPYLACDKKTLYFASKGHHGYGGYDIYVTERLDDSWTNWTEPKNLGPAINGHMDDEFFIISHCKRFAFFSKQISVHNVDLFKITIEDLFLKTKDEERVSKTKHSRLSGL
ncbi:MAG: hypothetical protein SH819_11175 [Cytophagales bacterium]|nr:hypothetical protein [Cytophagales bacterium]